MSEILGKLECALRENEMLNYRIAELEAELAWVPNNCTKEPELEEKDGGRSETVELLVDGNVILGHYFFDELGKWKSGCNTVIPTHYRRIKKPEDEA